MVVQSLSLLLVSFFSVVSPSLRCLNLTGIVSGCYDDDFESSAAEDEHELWESGEDGENGEEGESGKDKKMEKERAVSVQGHVCEELTEDIQEWSGLYSHSRGEGSASASVSHVRPQSSSNHFLIFANGCRTPCQMRLRRGWGSEQTTHHNITQSRQPNHYLSPHIIPHLTMKSPLLGVMQ